MALTTHWEWRAFGKASDRFRARFDELDPAFVANSAPEKLTDEYLWLPDVSVNLKFRNGSAFQDGLKFKRLRETRGKLEKWTEAADEIFAFPLAPRAWELLIRELNLSAGLTVRPPIDANRESAVAFLKWLDSRIRIVAVEKERRAGLWGTSGAVKVELAEIYAPVRTTSVGLELWDEGASIESLNAAIAGLGLDREDGLVTMNYLEFIRQ